MSASNKPVNSGSKGQNQALSMDNSSLLLVFHPSQNQQQQALSFLKKRGLVNSKPPYINLLWINADETGVKIKAVRELISQSSYGSYGQKKQIFVILSAQQSSQPAQNALLKILEEPPENIQIILTSAQPKRLLPTIHSRCKKINLSSPEKLEKAQKELSAKVIEEVAQQISNNDFNYEQAILLAEQFQQREEAIALLSALIIYFHQKLNQGNQVEINTNKASKITHHLLSAYQDLNKNLNVRLALEHNFFKIIQI